MEVWKPVLHWEGLYEVSSMGQVKSLPRGISKRYHSEVILKPTINMQGYLVVCLTAGDKTKKKGIHRLMLEAFTGQDPKNLQAAHINGIKTDNRIDNLYWATPSQNQIDRRAHGTATIGAKHHAAKLNPDKVREIRRLAKAGESKSAIARKFGVRAQSIDSVLRGETWIHVE